MKVHHLNCGSMREVTPPEAAGSARKTARVVNHCLLVETDSAGLVLIDAGFGTADIARPGETLGRTFLERAQPVLDPGEIALRQVEKLGYDAADVRHIVVTHLDLDHTGGMIDFPDATVHVNDVEYRAGMAATNDHPEHAIRRRPAHWAHRPHWATYTPQKGNSWFGFDAVELKGLPEDILLIPLAGHTEGHCAVAVRDADKWLLHGGDAYYHQGEVDPFDRWSIPMWEALEEITETDRSLRIANQARLRELLRDHGDEVEVFSAHDPWPFEQYARQAESAY